MTVPAVSIRPSRVWIAGLLLALAGALFATGAARADDDHDKPFDVLRGFTEVEVEKSDIVAISDERKHQIMFVMGFVLLITIITAAMLGVSMVAFGKQVFLAHMIFAGVSVFLAIVHAVTAIVWFFPF
jgi:hypothetical protein